MAANKLERRVHKRHQLACQAALINGKCVGGKEAVVLKCRSENISNGGVYLTCLPADLPPEPLPTMLSVKISLPRSTPNSFMYEEISTDAAIIRQSPAIDGRSGVALRFTKPLPLDLEV